MKSTDSDTSRVRHDTQTNVQRLPRWIYVVWAFPVSMVAMFLLPLALRQSQWRTSNGCLEVTSPGLRRFLRAKWARLLSGGEGFAAATIGSVIIACDDAALAECRTHERVHVRQCERWGPLFPIAYVAAGLWAAMKRKRWQNYYWDNPFEVAAREAETREADACAKRPVRQ